MKKRLLPTFFALIILVGLGIYANFYETETILSPGMEKPLKIIPAWDADIKKISWIDGTNEKFRVEKNAKGEFKLFQPEEFRTEKDDINTLLSQFAQLRSEMVVSKTESEKTKFGIGANSKKIRIEIATKTFEILLGTNAPTSKSVYICKMDAPQTFMVPEYIKEVFNYTSDNLRSKNIFYEDFTDINSIELTDNGNSISLAKENGIDWEIMSPTKTIADPQEVAALIFGVRDIKIKYFITDKASKDDYYGLKNPVYHLKMNVAANKSFELLAGKTVGDDVYVKRADEPSVYRIPQIELAKFKKTFDDLRQKILPEVDFDKLTQIEVKDSTGTIKLAKSDKKWLIGEVVADKDRLEKFFHAYKSAKVSEFPEATQIADNKLDSPETRDHVVFKTDKNETKVVFGEVQGANIVLLANNEQMVTTIPIKIAFQELMEALRPDALASKTVVSGGDKKK